MVEPASSINAKTTGFLRHCTGCRLPYPKEMVACPNCGSTDQSEEEETLSGQFGSSSQGTWSVQLLIRGPRERRRSPMGRTADAEGGSCGEPRPRSRSGLLGGDRVGRKAAPGVVDGGGQDEPRSRRRNLGLSWVAQIHSAHVHRPGGPRHQNRSRASSRGFRRRIGAALNDLTVHCRGAGSLSDEDARSLARLDQLRRGTGAYGNELS